MSYRKTDQDIVSKFEQNYKDTLRELIIRNQALTGAALANFLVGKLTEKFYWKRFFVFVASENKNIKDTLFVKNCGHGFTEFNYYGKTIIVNYADDKEESFDQAVAEQTLDNVPDVIEREAGSRDNLKHVFDLMKAECDSNSKIFIVTDVHQALISPVPDTNFVTKDISVTVGKENLAVTKKYKILIVG